MSNQYDDQSFFDSYSQMLRSLKGLDGAGEWPTLEKMLPDFQDKRVLDLGCGFGWHCLYAAERGAKAVTGVDISEKMLQRAKQQTSSQIVTYIQSDLQEVSFLDNSFDVVLSSLALHYIESFESICHKIADWLVTGGYFVFSVEHPIFTAEGKQDWFYSPAGEKLYWPVDRYFLQGKRKACFLGQQVEKYHRTLTTYLNTLLENGFELLKVVEPEPTKLFLKEYPEMAEELRRPMMLLISARKK